MKALLPPSFLPILDCECMRQTLARTWLLHQASTRNADGCIFSVNSSCYSHTVPAFVHATTLLPFNSSCYRLSYSCSRTTRSQCRTQLLTTCSRAQCFMPTSIVFSFYVCYTCVYPCLHVPLVRTRVSHNLLRAGFPQRSINPPRGRTGRCGFKRGGRHSQNMHENTIILNKRVCAFPRCSCWGTHCTLFRGGYTARSPNIVRPPQSVRLHPLLGFAIPTPPVIVVHVRVV